MGCGAGLECIACQLCGPCDQESGKRHTSDKKSGRDAVLMQDWEGDAEGLFGAVKPKIDLGGGGLLD